MKESTKLMIAFWALVHVLCLVLACGGSDEPEDYGYEPGTVRGGSSSGGSSGGGTSTESDELNQIRDAVVSETNTARSTSQDCGQHGVKGPVPPVQRNSYLDQAAQAHAADMADNEFVSHVGSDGSSFLVRVNRTGYTGTALAENVGMGYATVGGVVNGWVKSDGHCKVLMSSTATEIGVGYVDNGTYGPTWVQVYGK